MTTQHDEQPEATVTALQPKTDDYINTVTTLGTGKDKSTATFFVPDVDLEQEQLDALYEHEPLSARIVNRLVDDGTREGWAVTGADPMFDYAELNEDLERLGVNEAVADSWRWARLYGGSIIVLIVNDGTKMTEELNLQRATRLLSLQVVESPSATPDGLDPALGSKAFRNPRSYAVLAPGGVNARSIHASRIVRVEGMRVPPSRVVARNGWPPSVLDRVWTDVKRLGSVMGYAEGIMHELSMMTLQIEDFRSRASGTGTSKQELQRAVETMRQMMDNFRLLVMDTNDNLVETTRSVGGIDALIGRFVDALVRATDMPRTVLLGEQPSGLNANADSEIRSWFDFVHSQQKLVLTPILKRIIGMELLMRDRRNQPIPADWKIEYNSLWQPTEAEQADTDLKRAQAAAIKIDAGVVSPDEVRAKAIAEGRIEPLPTQQPEGAAIGT